MQLHVFFLMADPDQNTVDAWIQLLRARDSALAVVENALKDAGLPSLSWYDVLLEVERAGPGGIRASDLQKELLLPQYGISRLLSRIEAEGFITRRSSAEDGRAQEIVMTQEGRNLRRRMWAVYGPAIDSALGSKLSGAECDKLKSLLGKLL